MKAAPAAAYQVFGHGGFAGNTALLHELEALPEPEAMLAHAREGAGIDQAYFAPGDAPGHWRVRFFSPNGEILICGHALLALTRHLGEREGRERMALQSPHFAHEGRWRAGQARVSLPAYAFQAADDRLLLSLLHKARLTACGLALFPNRVWLAACAEPAEIEDFDRARFDWEALNPLSPGALILSAPLGPREYLFRYFAPWHGKPEDCGTGSAHCYLAPFWLSEGGEGIAWQASPMGRARMEVGLREGRAWVGGRVERLE